MRHILWMRWGWLGLVWQIGLVGLAAAGCDDSPSPNSQLPADAATQIQPSGESHWMKLVVSRDRLCGLSRPGFGLSCRAPDATRFEADLSALGVPSELATDTADLSLRDGWGCAIQQSTGGLRCFGTGGAAAQAPTEGKFTTVAVGAAHGCALDGEGLAHCFSTGEADDPRVQAPSEPLRSLVAGAQFTCGLRAQAAAGEWPVLCWGTRAWSEGLLTHRPAEQIAAGADFLCAATRSSATECVAADPALLPVAPRNLRRLVAGDRFACGEDLNGAVHCWGAAIEPPTEPISALAAGGPWLCHATVGDPDTVRCAATTAPTCSAEVLNGEDDDCDGEVDEGLGATVEIPDLIDNDEDGIADLPFLVELRRFVSSCGAPHRTGRDTCAPDETAPLFGCDGCPIRRNAGCALDTCWGSEIVFYVYDEPLPDGSMVPFYACQWAEHGRTIYTASADGCGDATPTRLGYLRTTPFPDDLAGLVDRPVYQCEWVWVALPDLPIRFLGLDAQECAAVEGRYVDPQGALSDTPVPFGHALRFR